MFLRQNDPRLAKYRKAAEKIGDTPEEFMAWIDRLFERYAALDGREVRLQSANAD
jgi:hypothetical protein